MENTREIALDALLLAEKGEELSHQLVQGVLDKYNYLERRDKAFLKRVIEGTLERRIELDYMIDAFSSVPVRRMKPLIRNLIRMSAYQLLYMDAIPDSAVCNEACKLAEKRKFQNLKGFVNGVLRKIAREKNAQPLPDPQKDSLQFLSVKYSMPDQIVDIWLSEYGRDMTETILKGLLEIHPVSVRISERVSEQEEKQVIARLEESGIQLRKSPYLERLYLTEGMEGAGNLPDFARGKITVQDASSVLAVKMAGIRPGDTVIDVCAAPGGKSILASELAGEQGCVIAGDVSEKKTEKIRENIARMCAENIEVREWDAREPDRDLLGKADVVLLDIPCSGLGVIGKKRDIKYRVNGEGLQALEVLQREIIRGAWQYVKPGGILLYSTCTVRRQENREMAEWILGEFPFEPVSIEGDLPQEILEGVLREREARKFCSGEMAGERAPDMAPEGCCAQLLPGVLGTDGFFFAKFRRMDRKV